MRPCEQVTVWCTACVEWRLRSLVAPCPRDVGASWEDRSLEVPRRLLAKCQGFPEISVGGAYAHGVTRWLGPPGRRACPSVCLLNKDMQPGVWGQL